MQIRPMQIRLLVAGAMLAGLSACSGGSGAPTQQNAAATQGVDTGYTGPAPATPDVQQFKIFLFDNIRTDDRCGSCHGVDGSAATKFARDDDVNLAYAEANTVVDLFSPEDSELVSRMEVGHNCWLTSTDTCATIMTTWISNWAGASVGSSGRKIELEPITDLREPGATLNFPDDDGALFGQFVYPILTGQASGIDGENCAQCHSSASAIQQSPFFADENVEIAYEAAKARIDLNNPDSSRFVERVRDESHNCWTSSCAADAVRLRDAIASMAGQLTPDEVPDNLVTSMALTLFEGTIASGGNRHEANVIASYEFKAGTGSQLAFDTSGVDPAMDLTLSGSVEWVGGWGLNFTGGKAQASTASSSKLRQMITSTGEYSIEAWVAPGNVVQEDVRIVSYSGGPDIRNFNLGQTMYNYDFFNRNDGVDAAQAENGDPALSTPDAAESLQATLQHVVVTFNPIDGRRIYVNGVLETMPDTVPGDTLNSWNNTYAFVLGNEVSGTRPFNGVLRLVAIHNRALTQEQIQQNFDAGVGQKFFLLFSVTHLVGIPDSYIVFEASVFDSYAYLFREPFFISLDPDANPVSIDIEGIRIGVNGVEAPVGQAFANVDAQITAVDYDSEVGQEIAQLGTVLPIANGPDLDEFFLTFDRIATFSSTRPSPGTPPDPTPVDLPEASLIGVRTFDEVNATMATLTGVDPAVVSGTYDLVRQSLPAVPTMEAVLSSHQIAIAQLSIAYCDALIENTTLRDSTFGSAIWGNTPATLFPDAGNEAILTTPLLDRLVGATQLTIQPDRALIEQEVSMLINGISGDDTRNGLAATNPNSVQRTATIGKAVCSTILGNAAMLVK